MKTKILFTALLTSLLTLNFSFAQTTPNSCLDLKFNMKYKSNDKRAKGEVSKLQNFLAQNGHLVGVTANGNYGPATIKAVKDFQKANNLIVTGVVGNVTRGKVNELSCAASASYLPVASSTGEVSFSFLPNVIQISVAQAEALGIKEPKEDTFTVPKTLNFKNGTIFVLDNIAYKVSELKDLGQDIEVSTSRPLPEEVFATLKIKAKISF